MFSMLIKKQVLMALSVTNVLIYLKTVIIVMMRVHSVLNAEMDSMKLKKESVLLIHVLNEIH